MSDEPVRRGDLEEALRLLNHYATQERLTHADLTATVRALIDTLVARGLLPPAEYERRRQRALDSETAALAAEPVVRLAPAVDKYAVGPLPEIDCAALLPLCKARCCTFAVDCSAQDLDEGLVQWDYARPYRLRRRDEDGYCVHSEPATRRCDIYARRPAICRTYDCRDDARIWRDFARRIPAEP